MAWFEIDRNRALRMAARLIPLVDFLLLAFMLIKILFLTAFVSRQCIIFAPVAVLLSLHFQMKRRKVAKAKMFSFHKPKVYRSSTGCCICKAKSSSSRFTDSKKYEEDFIKCFQLEERRSGEICNACVLLVKRWKKLPVGSSRNWRHVVDARAGPGIKSLTKFKAKNKKKNKDVPEKFDKILKKKHVYTKNDRDREQSPAMSDDLTEEYLTGTGSKGSSRAGSPAGSDDTGVGEKRLDIDQQELDISNFIDLTYFKRKNVCCGVIFVGMMGEVMIEPTLLKPCMGCLARQQRQRIASASAISMVASSSPSHSSASASPCHSSASTSPAHSVDSGAENGKAIGKGFCDSSSDSGYDDSNQSIVSVSKSLNNNRQHPPSSQTLHLLAKPSKPISKVQSQKLEKTILPVSTTLRLKGLSGGGAKMPIKLLCKPVALVSSAKLSLSQGGSRPVDTVLAVPTPVDFSVRPSSHRQSLAN